MNDWFQSQVFSIGILGGGRGGNGLFQFFRASSVARICFVVDPNPSAPAIVAAREAGIPVFTDDDVALSHQLPDFLFDSTGDAELEARVKHRIMGSATRFITPITSRMMVQVIEENATRVREEVSGIVTQIKQELGSSLDGSRGLVQRINQIMGSMQMLALNASIEAAKAGAHGRGFAVVADHMGKSVENVRKVTQEIDAVNANILQVSHQVDAVLGKLH